MERARAELRASRKAGRKAEVEVERADACLEKLREIHRLKVAPDTLKKIFHGMPASPRHAPLAAGKKGKKGETHRHVRHTDTCIQTHTSNMCFGDTLHSLPAGKKQKGETHRHLHTDTHQSCVSATRCTLCRQGEKQQQR